jgi:acyl carrier protein
MSIDALLGLVRDDLGLPVSGDQVDRDLAELPGWDSMHLLWLVTVLERETGHAISVIDLLEARSLAELHDVVVAFGR